LSLPSGDQADILVDWLKTEQARYFCRASSAEIDRIV
jgi:hypothetical protein